MNNSDLIDKYIQKTATPEELQEINRLLIEDPAFKEEFYFHLELKEVIKIEENKKLKKQLQKLDTEKSPKKFYLNIYKVAAVLIIGLGILLFFNTSPNYDKIYAENFEVYPNVVQPVVRNENEEKTLTTKAFIAYENRDFAKASEMFEAISKDTQEEYALFYKAISLMELNQMEQADVILSDTSW